MSDNAEKVALWREGPCEEDYDEHACAFYCQDGCLSRVSPPNGTGPNNPIIHRPGCSWETTPYCNCGVDPERLKPPEQGGTD